MDSKFFHSSLRMHVEQSFSLLVARWGVFWRSHKFSLSLNAPIVQLAAALYKYCIETSEGSAMTILSPPQRRGVAGRIRYAVQYGEFLTYANSAANVGRRGPVAEHSTTRLTVIDYIASQGRKRPPSST